jgi:hypothetical protein
MEPKVWVPLLVVGILAFQACLWIVIISAWRKRTAQAIAAINQELAERSAKGERTVLGPLPCRLRRGYRSGSTVVALTNERLILGSRHRKEFPLRELLDVREDGWFNTKGRAGYTWVIIKLKENEFGLTIRSGEHSRWVEALKSARPA